MGSVYQLYSASYRNDAQLILLIHERITWFGTVRLKEVRLLFVVSSKSSQSSLACRLHAYIYFLIIVNMLNNLKINDLKIAIFVAFLCLLIIGNRMPINKYDEAVHDDKSEDELYCRDDENKPVDWFVAYKLPGGKKRPLTDGGSKYAYITNRTIDSGNWILSNDRISRPSSMMGRTLAPLYEPNALERLKWTMYSDKNPEQRSARGYNGHSKGVVIANTKNVLWLIHSVPGFPNRAKKEFAEYGYPHYGLVRGQSFMCISMPISQYETVLGQLRCNKILAYETNPRARDSIRRYNRCMRYATITSLDGVKFISFAKISPDIELYSGMVGRRLESNLYVQSRTNGKARIASQPGAMNVGRVVWKFEEWGAANLAYNSNCDHSKWAVSIDDELNKYWICIGDINREETQKKRGGGAVCIHSRKLWKAYRNLIYEYEDVRCGEERIPYRRLEPVSLDV